MGVELTEAKAQRDQYARWNEEAKRLIEALERERDALAARVKELEAQLAALRH